MTRAGRLALALALALGGAARAQQPADVPAGQASLRGVVVHAERPQAVADVEVVLYALPAHGTPGVRRTRTDASGAFAFEGIANDPDTPYLVGARYEGVPHPGPRVVFEAGESERVVEVRIADVSDDPGPIVVREVSTRIDWVGNELVVRETVRLDNRSPRTFYVPADRREPAAAAFATRLPAGATDLSFPFGIAPEGAEQRGRALSFYGPLYPGEQEVGYRFSLPVAPGADGARQAARVQLGRSFGRPVDRVVVRVPAEDVEPLGPGLPAATEETVEGRRYRALAWQDVRAGAALELALSLPPLAQQDAALSLAEVRLFVELDDAATLVREEYHFEVGGSGRRVGTADAPLLHIPLPPDASDLGFHPDYGLLPHPDGGISVLGPVPAGEPVLELLYRLPPTTASVELERRFGAPVSLLTVYLADTGVLAESTRLHRRRPVRTPDRTYIHLEAFEVTPDETIALQLTPLPARGGLPRPARLALLLALAAGVAAFLAGPLRRPGAARAEAVPEASKAREERDAVVAEIRDLDHDYETGKLAETDYRALREELRARGLALLRAERERAQRPSVAPEAEAGCSACGARPHPGDRFCAQCGAALAGGTAEEREARG